MNILITGGAGYIGSHICHSLIDGGFNVSVIDNLSIGKKNLLPKEVTLLNCDISNTKKILPFLEKNKFDVVMHLAALTSVSDSLKNPKKYLENNFEKGKIFINLCLKNNIKKFIFSSTAAVYGNLESINNITESEKTNPINPYSDSKLKFEQYLTKEVLKENAFCVILRYFNVAGADLKRRTGYTSDSDNLIKLVCEVAARKRNKLIINGNDYQTKDGTPIRDYIHVLDLADAHKSALDYLNGKDSQYVHLNIGTGNGTSVLELVKTFIDVNRCNLKYKFGARRLGDPCQVVANNELALNTLEWKPKKNIEDMCRDGWRWQINSKELMKNSSNIKLQKFL